MNKRLSICIPTYNRLNILKDSIEDNLSVFFENNIELCIANNASTDGTGVYLKNLVKKYPQIKYKCQESNVGIDKNMLDVMNIATADYIYPMGDDDKLIIENLPLLLNLLSEDKDLILLNGYKGSLNHLPKTLYNKQFKNIDEAFINIWNKMPFGSFLFKKKLLNQEYFENYIGTSHAYTGVIWETLYDIQKINKEVNIYCTSLPIVFFKDEEKTWKNDYYKIMFFEIPLWFELLSKKYSIILSKNISSNYINSHIKFRKLVGYRIKGYLTTDNISNYSNFLTKSDKERILQVNKLPYGLILFVHYLESIYIKIKLNAKKYYHA